MRRSGLLVMLLGPVALGCLAASAGCSESPWQPRREAADGNPPQTSGNIVQPEASTAQAAHPRLVLEGDALLLDGAKEGGRRIAFGSPAAAALSAAGQVYGPASSEETLEECGAGPLQVSRFGGITIASQDGKFAGWSLDERNDEPRPATGAGVGIGSGRNAVEKAYNVEPFESSLGQEFTAKGIGGLLSGADKLAKVTHLWAGATCIMR